MIIYCPECKTDLKKKAKQGEGVRFCPKCSCSWHILKISLPLWQRKEMKTEEEQVEEEKK